MEITLSRKREVVRTSLRCGRCGQLLAAAEKLASLPGTRSPTTIASRRRNKVHWLAKSANWRR